MKGRVSTNDIILSGELNVNKNVNLETLQATENKTYNVPEGVDGWDEVIVNVPSEEINIESKSITENGTYNAPVGVAGYNPITVDVQPDLEDIKITENGTYTPTAGKDGFSEVEVDVDPNLQILEADTNGTFYPTEGKDGFSYAVVDVPQRPAVVLTKTITANGTYTVPTGVDGYNPVIVNVPQQTAVIESKTITENGTYTPAQGVDGFAPVVVNVPSREPVIDPLRIDIDTNGQIIQQIGPNVDGYGPIEVNVDIALRLQTLSVSDNGTYTPDIGNDGFSQVTVNVPSDLYMPLNNTQISSISNKYMGAISTTEPITPGYYVISHYNSDQLAGGTNLAIVKIESLPTTTTLSGLSNFILILATNSVEVDNYDGSAKDVYMSIVKIPSDAICVKPD